MKVLNQVFKMLSGIVIAAIVIYMAVAAPILLGYRPMAVLSGSMEPTYPVGSIIYYHENSFDELEVGDPVTFYAGSSLVTHRIMRVDEASQTVVTKGDHNKTEDPVPVKAAEIAGKATNFAIPYAGYFVTYGKNPAVIAGMAVILLLSYILEEMVSEPKEGKEIDDQKKQLPLEAKA